MHVSSQTAGGLCYVVLSRTFDSKIDDDADDDVRLLHAFVQNGTSSAAFIVIASSQKASLR